MDKRAEWSGKALERRRNQALRQAFEGVFRMLTSYRDSQQGWSGEPLQQVSHFVRECFPALTGREVQVLVTAAQRVYVERLDAQR